MGYRPIQSGLSGLLLTLPAHFTPVPLNTHTSQSCPTYSQLQDLCTICPLTRALFPLTSHDSFSHLLPILLKSHSLNRQSLSTHLKLSCASSHHFPCPFLFILHSTHHFLTFSQVHLFTVFIVSLPH